MSPPDRLPQAVVIGCSTGGLEVLRELVCTLPAQFPVPVMVVSHTPSDSDGLLAQVLDHCGMLPVSDAEDKEIPLPGHLYIAPAGYHLLVEENRSFSLSVDAKVNHCRPAIDVLFESAAVAYRGRVIGVLLSGANRDGCLGLTTIKRAGGITVVQDPTTAKATTMPNAAIQAGVADYVVAPSALAELLQKLL